jgi:hypothetical protein
MFSRALPHSAAGLFVQNLHGDEHVWSRAMPHTGSAGQNCIALDKLVKLSTRYDLKEQSVKKSFIGDFPYIIPFK